MRRAFSLGLIALAVVLGGSAVLAAQSRSRPPASFAAAAVISRPTAATPAPSIPDRRPTASRLPSSPVGFQPSTVELAGLFQADIRPILSVAGQLQPPYDPAEVGWWQASALAGTAAGATVLVGHVDSAEYGPGAFYRLDKVTVGSIVRLSDGSRTVSYAVRSLAYVPKATGLPADLFRSSGSPQLVLISCGGSFDRASLSYRDNVVVTAIPSP